MITTTTEAELRRRLLNVERQIATIQTAAKHLPRLEGRRDELIRELSDLEGAHDRRFVGAR